MQAEDKSKGKKFELKKSLFLYQKWLILSFVILFVAYVFIIIILNSFETSAYIISWITFFFFLVGTVFVIYETKYTETSKIVIKDLDFIFAFLGVIVTYELSNLFSISVIITSASIGLVGHYLFRKNEMAIYCGSFAGMTSFYLLNHYQVLLLALIVGSIYLLVKTILNGYGGKLGTIAFISTTITVWIFSGSVNLPVQTYNILLVFLFGILGVIIPFIFQDSFKQSSVVASALPSLIVAVVITIFWSQYSIYSAVFFTASFAGMSSKKIMPNLINSLILGLVLSIIFLTFFEHFNGFGGKMGLSAFISVTIYIGLISIFNYLRRLLSKNP